MSGVTSFVNNLNKIKIIRCREQRDRSATHCATEFVSFGQVEKVVRDEIESFAQNVTWCSCWRFSCCSSTCCWRSTCAACCSSNTMSCLSCCSCCLFCCSDGSSVVDVIVPPVAPLFRSSGWKRAKFLS